MGRKTVSVISIFSLALIFFITPVFAEMNDPPIFYEPFNSVQSVRDNNGLFTMTGTLATSNSPQYSTFETSIDGNALHTRTPITFNYGPEFVQYPIHNDTNINQGTIEFLFKDGNWGGLINLDSNYPFPLGARAKGDSSIMSFAGGLTSGANTWMEFNGNGSYRSQAQLVFLYVNFNVWNHVAMSWNFGPSGDGRVKLYLNGKMASTIPLAMDTNFLGQHLLRVGNSFYYGSHEGSYDEVKLFNYVRTDAQVFQDYNSYSYPPVACRTDADCGAGQSIGGPYCSQNNVYQITNTSTCSNPGTYASACVASSQEQLRQVCSLSCSLGACMVKNPSTGSVKIEGRKLFVDGTEYKVKAVGYAPVPIGSSPDLGYDVTAHPELWARDFILIRGMNANTIRTWGKVRDTNFLDAAWNNGNRPIRAIMGYWMGGNDFQNQATRQTILADFNAYVTKFKNHPAVLTWAIGNEENWFYAMQFGDNQRLAAYMSLVNEMAQNAFSIEGASYHPVTAVSLEMPQKFDTIGNYAGGAGDANIPYVDIWGLNNYPGQSFGNYLNTFAIKTTKPLLITEYGIDALNNNTTMEYEQTQADWDVNLWREISTSSVAIGASLMEYSDEWWKGYGGDISTHDNLGYPTSSHPDLYANEEWWGIMRTAKNGSSPDTMTPRQAYYALQKEFGCGVSLTAATYEQWKLAKFSSAELTNTAISGETADPDGDGINNLAEYALCLDPKVRGTAGLPRAAIEDGNFIMIYNRVKNTIDVNFLVELSRDLFTWNSGPAYTGLLSIIDNGSTERVKVMDMVPVPQGRAQGYMRLKITKTTGAPPLPLAKLFANFGPLCSNNSDCGTSGFIENTYSCSENSLYQTYRTYACNNPGQLNSTCTNTETNTLKENCGTTTYSEWSEKYCEGNNVMHSRATTEPTCGATACSTSMASEVQATETCEYGCQNGACQPAPAPAPEPAAPAAGGGSSGGGGGNPSDSQLLKVSPTETSVGKAVKISALCKWNFGCKVMVDGKTLAEMQKSEGYQDFNAYFDSAGQHKITLYWKGTSDTLVAEKTISVAPAKPLEAGKEQVQIIEEAVGPTNENGESLQTSGAQGTETAAEPTTPTGLVTAASWENVFENSLGMMAAFALMIALGAVYFVFRKKAK